MTDLEVIDHEALVPYRPPAPTTLFGTEDPAEVVAKASASADALVKIVRDPKRGLISNISGKEYPKVEAWTLLGSMLGVFPVCIWTRKMEDGWEARVEAHTRDGAVVGAAEAECLRSERNWKSRDDFALRSMAQTRATSKALRLPLGFVMALAGIEATPAEEMVTDAAPTQQPAPAGNGTTPPAASKQQLGFISGLMGELAEAGVADKDDLKAYARKEYGVAELENLSGGRNGQASELISRLQVRLAGHLLDALGIVRGEEILAEHGGGATDLPSVEAGALAGLIAAAKKAGQA